MKLSKQSKDLILYFHKNNYIKQSKFTRQSREIFSKLYYQIEESYDYSVKYYNHSNLKIKKLLNNTHIIKPKKFHPNSFPNEILNHIESNTNYEISYSFILSNRHINLYFLTKDKKTEHTMTKYIKSIMSWFYILNIYSLRECVKNINVYFYFTSLQKQLPETKNIILDEIHINTAFTTSCPKDSEIVVFRQEEWFKVFIHETFHTFGLDFSIMDTNMLDKCILNIFKVNSKVNSYEAYTEFWAEIINVVYCSYHLNKNNTIHNFLSNVELLIHMEKIYSIYQLVKILDFMGLQYTDLYLKSKFSQSIRENYKENTNVLSYFIIKSILLNNSQDFLKWCNQHNGENSILNFKKTENNQNDFCKFIVNYYNKSEFITNIDKTTLFYENNKSYNNQITRNLRMTICELE
jgi:hypothetical protein